MKNNTKNKGFTILEVIIALGILSVSLLVIINLFPKGIKMTRESKEISVATNLAKERIEELISESYENIPTGTIDVKARLDNNPQNQFYIYQREALAEYVDSDLATSVSDTGLKKITVSVYWTENAQEKNVRIIRLLNQR